MEKLRINIPYQIAWPILTDGEPTSLEGRDIRMEVRDVYGRVQELQVRTTGNIILAEFPVEAQKRLGPYIATAWEDKGKPTQNAVDIVAFELVRWTFLEKHDETSNLQVVTVNLASADIGRDNLKDFLFAGDAVMELQDTDEVLIRRGDQLMKISAADLRLWCNHGLKIEIK